MRGEAVAGAVPVVQVSFVEYPRSRHRKGVTRAEVKRGRRLLHPIVVRTGVEAINAVIETASDGIYEFRAETAAGRGAEASCTLVLFGRSGERRVRHLGWRKLGGSSPVVRVLMPEGMIWDDDATFDGTIEDAESVTKYDSETGVVWKEYK